MRLLRSASLGCVALFGVACASGEHNVRVDWQVVAEADVKNVQYPAIEAAQVCVDDHPEIGCVKTDADGFFSLPALPAQSDLVLIVKKDGFVPVLKPLQTGDAYLLIAQPIVMLKPNSFPEDLGYDVDLKESGLIDFTVFQFLDPQGYSGDPAVLPGVKVWLSPETESKAVYIDNDGQYDASLGSTQFYSGTFGFGNLTMGRFFNVPPGDYQVNFTPPRGYTCSSLGGAWGYPIEGKSAVRAPVRAGYATADIAMHCQH